MCSPHESAALIVSADGLERGGDAAVGLSLIEKAVSALATELVFGASGMMRNMGDSAAGAGDGDAEPAADLGVKAGMASCSASDADADATGVVAERAKGGRRADEDESSPVRKAAAAEAVDEELGVRRAGKPKLEEEEPFSSPPPDKRKEAAADGDLRTVCPASAAAELALAAEWDGLGLPANGGMALEPNARGDGVSPPPDSKNEAAADGAGERRMTDCSDGPSPKPPDEAASSRPPDMRKDAAALGLRAVGGRPSDDRGVPAPAPAPAPAGMTLIMGETSADGEASTRCTSGLLGTTDEDDEDANGTSSAALIADGDGAPEPCRTSAVGEMATEFERARAVIMSRRLRSSDFDMILRAWWCAWK